MIKLSYPAFWNKPNLITYLLWPLSLIYRMLGWLRHLLVKPQKIAASVICIGNHTVGGTGKTPIVKYLAQALTEHNIEFIILAKAYNVKNPVTKIVEPADSAVQVGDEPKLLSRYGKVLATANMRQAIEMLKNLNPQIVLCDDGLQSPYLHKDINILVLDSHRTANDFLIPAGPLREPLAQALSKSQLVIVTGNGRLSDNILTKINSHQLPLIFAQSQIQHQLDVNKKYLAFTAIGNPQKFFDSLANFQLTATRSFPDHYQYQIEDIQRLQHEANVTNSTLLTTEKDYVKLPDKTNIECVLIELKLSDPNLLQNIINEKIKTPN